MNPFVALCLWSCAIIYLGFYLGQRFGWLNARHRCATIADKTAVFCGDNAIREPRDRYSPFWAARCDEAQQIAMKIRNTTDCP